MFFDRVQTQLRSLSGTDTILKVTPGYVGVTNCNNYQNLSHNQLWPQKYFSPPKQFVHKLFQSEIALKHFNFEIALNAAPGRTGQGDDYFQTGQRIPRCNPAPMPEGRLSGNGQPKANAAALARSGAIHPVKRAKNVFQLRFRHARAKIPDADAQISALAPRLKQNFAIVRGVEYRVGQNIAKQTPQQPRLALDNQAGRYAVTHVFALRAALKSKVSGQFGQQAA